MSIIPEKLAALIRQARGGRSQREFAKLIGVSQTAVSDWESGAYFPSLENAEALARCLGMDVAAFVASCEEEELGEVAPFHNLLKIIDVSDGNKMAAILRKIAERLEGQA